MITYRCPQLVVLVFAVLCYSIPHDAFAQAPPPPPPIREGSAEFAFVGTSGNTSTQTIGIGGELIYRPAPWEMRFKTAYVRNEADDEVTAQSLLFAVRAQRSLRPALAAYGQYGYQRDRFAGILNRNALEGGLAYTLFDRARHTFVVDGGLGYTHEGRVLGEDLSTATAGTGAIYTLRLSPTSTIVEDGRFSFSFDEGDDWRYANALSLTATMTTIFSLKVSNTIRYVHMPVLGFENTDMITAIALVAEF